MPGVQGDMMHQFQMEGGAPVAQRFVVQEIPTLAGALSSMHEFIAQLNNPSEAILVPADFDPQYAREEFIMQSQGVLSKAAKFLQSLASGNVNIDHLAGELQFDVSAMIANARNLANSADQDISLIPGALAVSEAIANILQCAKNVRDNPNDKAAQMALKIAQTGLQAANLAMKSAQQGILIPGDNKELVLQSAYLVGNSANQLVEQSFTYSKGDPKLTAVINYTKALGDGVLYSAKTLANYISNPECMQHVGSLSTSLLKSCNGIISSFGGVLDPTAVANLNLSVKNVSDSINQLLQASKTIPKEDQFDKAASAIADINKHALALLNPQIGQQATIDSYKAIAGATSILVNCAKLITEGNPKLQAKLLPAAKRLAANTTSLYSAAKIVAQNPNDAVSRENLMKGSRAVMTTCGEFNTHLAKEVALVGLRQNAILTASAISGLITASESVSISDPKLQDAVWHTAGNVRTPTAYLVKSIAQFVNNPNDKEAQVALLVSSKNLSHPASQLISASKASLRKIEDGEERKRLTDATNAVATALQALRDNCNAIEEIGGGKEIKEALEELENLEADIESQIAAADSGFLTGPLDQNRGQALDLLSFSVHNLQAAVADMANNSVNDPDKVGESAQLVNSNVNQVIQSAKALAGLTRGKDAQKLILKNANDVIATGRKFFDSVKAVVIDPDNDDLLEPLEKSKTNVNQSCVSLMNAARGINTAEIDVAIEAILGHAQQFTIGRGTNFTAQLAEFRQTLNRYGASASQVLSAAMTNPKALGSASRMVSQITPQMVTSTNNIAALFDQETAQKVLDAAKRSSMAMVDLINKSKAAAAQNSPNSAVLRQSNVNFHQCIKQLLDTVKPGQTDINNALETINNALSSLDSPEEEMAVINMPLWELHQAMRQIAGISSGIMSEARAQTAELGSYSKKAAGTVSELVNASILLINPQENPCSILANKIITACTDIQANPENKSKVVQGTKSLASWTKEVIGAAKEIRGTNEYKTNIIKLSQALGAATANLGKSTKSLISNEPGADNAVSQAADFLRQRAEQLRSLALNKEAPPLSEDLSHNIISSTRAVATATSQLISAASAVSDDPSNYNAENDMSSAVNSLSSAIANLQSVSSELAPGAKEVNLAIKNIQKSSNELDSLAISISAGVDNSNRKSNVPLQVTNEQLVGNLRDLATQTQNLIKNTVDHPDLVPQTVVALDQITNQVGQLSLQLAFSTDNPKAKQSQIANANSVLKSVVNFLRSAHNANMNPSDNDLIETLTDSSQQVKDAITALGGELQGGMLVLKECDEALQSINRSAQSLGSLPNRDPTKTYQDCQKAIKSETRILANGLSNLLTTCSKNPDQIGVACKELSQLIQQLVDSTRLTAVTTKEVPIQQKLTADGKKVCQFACNLVTSAKKLAENANDSIAQNLISNNLNSLTDAVSELLHTVREGATAERDIDGAAEMISLTKIDLDNAALYAASGQFTVNVSEGKNVEESLAELKQSLISLNSNGNNLADSSKGFQEQLAVVAKAVSANVSAISNSAKETASLLPDLLSQQSVLTGARAITIAAQQLVLASKDAQANPLDNAAQKSLEQSKDALVAAISQLQSISETASADLIKTIKELQKAIREIKTNYKLYSENDYLGNQAATPKDVLIAARAIAKTNGALLSTYGSDQDSFIKAVHETAIEAKRLIENAQKVRSTTQASQSVIKFDDNVKAVINTICAMLETAKLQRIDDPTYYKKFSDSSELCITKLHDLISSLQLFPGGEGLNLEDNDSEDVANSELQAAIAAIEAAKNMLLDPSKWIPADGAFDLGDIAVQIVNATKSVAMATQKLVITATDVQNEIVGQGRATSKKLGQVYKKDPAWEEGLISAAKAVAGTTEDLVSFANQSIKGECGEEMLVACVRGVGGATARLVSAAKAKADPFSDSHKSLGACAKLIAEATQELANATKAATEKKVEAEIQKKNAGSNNRVSFAGLRAKELEEQARIAKLELELERARQNLFSKRKSEYQS